MESNGILLPEEVREWVTPSQGQGTCHGGRSHQPVTPQDDRRHDYPPEAVDYIPIARQPQRLPVVLTRSEISRLLAATPSLKWLTALSVAYGAGLRAPEVVSLKVGDIDSERMRIRVQQGNDLPLIFSFTRS